MVLVEHKVIREELAKKEAEIKKAMRRPLDNQVLLRSIGRRIISVVNILFIHEIDWLKKVVFEIHTLSELLSLFGHHVYVIDYESMWKKERFFDFGSLRTKVIDNVSRAYPDAKVSLRRPGFIKIPGLSRFSAIFTQYREIRQTIKEKKIDAIVLYSVPTSGWQAINLAKKIQYSGRLPLNRCAQPDGDQPLYSAP